MDAQTLLAGKSLEVLEATLADVNARISKEIQAGKTYIQYRELGMVRLWLWNAIYEAKAA